MSQRRRFVVYGVTHESWREAKREEERRELWRPALWGHVRLGMVDTQIDIWLLGALVAWGLGTALFWLVVVWLVILTIRWYWLADRMEVDKVT